MLLRLAGHRGGSPDCAPTCEVDVSQEGLAVMANLSRSTVGGILRSLEKVGLLEVRYRLIRLLDPERLAQFIAEDEDRLLSAAGAMDARLAFARGAGASTLARAYGQPLLSRTGSYTAESMSRPV